MTARCSALGRLNRFVPQLESLEDRWCPSASIVINGAVLTVNADNQGDTIYFHDNGAGKVSALIESPKGDVKGSATGISTIKINGGSGNDTIDYDLNGVLITNRGLVLCLDKGDDKVNLDFGAGITSSKLDVDVEAGKGCDKVAIKLGTIADSTVSLMGCLGKGDDTFKTDLLGNILGDSKLGYSRKLCSS
jgi:hypothetical protein